MSMKHHDPAMVGKPKYDRIPNDLYPTPPWCTQALLDNMAFNSHDKIWEPACGLGHISKVLKENGLSVVSSDLMNYGYGRKHTDFLKTRKMRDGSKHIITNPPYGPLAEEFIRHALKLTKKVDGTVSMFLRNEFDCASSRQDIFDTPEFCFKLTLTTRPRWIEGSTGSPRHNFSWFHWDWGDLNSPAMQWYHKRERSK